MNKNSFPKLKKNKCSYIILTRIGGAEVAALDDMEDERDVKEVDDDEEADELLTYEATTIKVYKI